MIRKLAALALLFTITLSASAQVTPTATPGKSRRPDIPGTFALELGINRLMQRPNELKYGFWGSRTMNVYYQHDMRIGDSKFTFHPGIGLGMERFKLMSSKQFFSNDTVTHANPTLAYDAAGNTVFLPAANVIYDYDSLGQIDHFQSYSTKKSMIALTYIDVPLELRFNVNPEDPARSFKIGVGGRAGYLINAHTKIKYKEDGDVKRLKNSQYYNLSRFRYSAFLKVYLGNFSIFGYYNFNPLFEEGKGPMQTKTNSYTVGISLASF
jgi:hypothetical protein